MSTQKKPVATSAPVALPPLPSLGIGGSAAVLSVNVVHPIETIKTRVQVHGTGVIGTTVSLIRKEGMASLWKGIQAAWGTGSLLRFHQNRWVRTDQESTWSRWG